jgi:hypothetical protein
MVSMSSFSFLARSWWKYLLAAAVPALVLPYIFQQMDKPKEEETLQVFLPSEIRDTTFLDGVSKAMKEKGIRQFNLYNFPDNLDAFSGMYSLQGLLYSDVILSPKSALDAHEKEGYYLPLDAALASFCPSGSSYYENAAGEKLGVLLYEKSGSSLYDPLGYADWLSLEKEDEALYLSLNAKLPNIGGYNSVSLPGDTQAILTFEALVSPHA